MAYIYLIRNKINNKLYVGKTQGSIENRLKEHFKASKRQSCKNRPLYSAIRKYGDTAFDISILEECDYTLANKLEKQWILKLKTFKEGYNATLGGDGQQYLNYDSIIEAYKQTKSLRKTAKLVGADVGYISKILRLSSIVPLTSMEVNKKKEKNIKLMNRDLSFEKTFNSIKEAGKYLIDNNFAKGGESSIRSHISQVASGKRKSAYGYKWKFI